MPEETVVQAKRHELRTAISALEAEYRAYRQAADRFHSVAETGLVTALGLLEEGNGNGHNPRPNGALQSAAASERDVLTNRERQVLRLIAAGHSTKQAAATLGITFKTAAGHRCQMMKKLGIHDTASLVRYAIRTRLIDA